MRGPPIRLSDELHHVAGGGWHFVCGAAPSDVEELEFCELAKCAWKLPCECITEDLSDEVVQVAEIRRDRCTKVDVG